MYLKTLTQVIYFLLLSNLYYCFCFFHLTLRSLREGFYHGLNVFSLIWEAGRWGRLRQKNRGHTHTHSTPIHWLTSQMSTIAKARMVPKLGARNTIQVSQAGDRNCHLSHHYCFPGLALAGNQSYKLRSWPRRYSDMGYGLLNYKHTCLFLPKLVMLKPKPKVVILKGGTFGRWFRRDPSSWMWMPL